MSITSINSDQAKQKIDHADLLVVDVRTPDEYSRGHLKNSLSLPLDELERQAAENLPDKNQPILVYCLSGSRSIMAAELLNQLGYKHLFNLTHGLMEWRIKQFPLEN